MIRKIITVAAIALSGIAAHAQTTQEEFLDRYNLLVEKLGVTGVGVETLLNKWEAAYPDDTDMLTASFVYYYNKSQTVTTVPRSPSSYLWQKPLLQFKDSLDNPGYYCYDTEFDDEMFGLAQTYAQKVIQAYPDRLENRFAAITALVSYEKESPDMALSELKSLVDYNYTSKPAWTYDDEPADEETFKAGIQEYCYTFFKTATPSSYEAFKSLSEKMLQYNPNDVVFLDNVGSYYYVGKNDSKTAQKYYDKVLNIKADDLTAIQNCVIMARKAKNTKSEKKYLAMLVQYAGDEASKLSAQARLDYLNGKK